MFFLIVSCFQVGEEIIERLTTSGKHVNVETKTALIKGYVHSGEIAKAEKIFLSTCESKGMNVFESSSGYLDISHSLFSKE